jgi:thymidine kinase
MMIFKKLIFNLWVKLKIKMGKLLFLYGCVSSSKTMEMICKIHTLEKQGKNVYVLKPNIDNRFGDDLVKSKTGLHHPAINIFSIKDIENLNISDNSFVFVDEVQFFDESIILFLRKIATEKNVLIFCYGLKTNFKKQLFSGSKLLLEIADVIEEIISTCFYCNKKSSMNLKLKGSEKEVEMGGTDMYRQTCYSCFQKYNNF